MVLENPLCWNALREVDCYFTHFLYRAVTDLVAAFSNVLSTGEATLGVLCPVVGSSIEERHEHTGAKGHKDKGTAPSLL